MKPQEFINLSSKIYITSHSLFNSFGSKYIKLFYSSVYLCLSLHLYYKLPMSDDHFLRLSHFLPSRPTPSASQYNRVFCKT